MKTLYEILEVSENASGEIIEKAYKVLAKKYHPDLQAEENKQEAENRMKEINEAYDILSDENKRKDYDNKLAMERQEEKIKEENNYKPKNTYSQVNYQQQYAQPQENSYNNQRNMTEEEYRQEQRKREEAIKANQKYQQAYEGYLKSLGYKIKYKWTWKNYKDLLITILIIIAICAILWIFPPTHKLIMDFYNSNNIIKAIIDVIGNVFKGIWNAICSIFK